MGSLLMRPQDIDRPLCAGWTADVAWPQQRVLATFPCQSRDLSAIVNAGRTQAALNSQWKPAFRTVSQKTRSRGCRAPRSPSWPFVWSPSWPLAPRKPKKSCMLTSLFRSNRPIPANTNNTSGRAFRAGQASPAPILRGIGCLIKEVASC